MKVLVAVKQVPARSVPMDNKNGILDRSKAGGRLNPWDYYAVEAALKLAENTNGTVTALSMGPLTAVDTLREVLSLGVNDAYLLSDKDFSGADVHATAYTLAQGISALGDFDAIVCGQQTTDGDTAQLPFSLGEKLGIASIGWVKGIEEIKEDAVTLSQELSFGTQTATVKTPFLMTVGEGIGNVRIPTLREQLKAKKKEVKILTLSDLENKNPLSYGLEASPTRVLKIKEIEHSFKNKPILANAKESAEIILKEVEGV